MLIRYRGEFRRFADPWRRPRHLIATARSPVASLSDKLRVVRLRRRVCRGTLDECFARPETTTIEALRSERFSDRIIERFFRPFLGGVFLDLELRTSSRMFDFVFRMFAEGDAALPAHGMGTIARQIANQLPRERSSPICEWTMWTESPSDWRVANNETPSQSLWLAKLRQRQNCSAKACQPRVRALRASTSLRTNRL